MKPSLQKQIDNLKKDIKAMKIEIAVLQALATGGAKSNVIYALPTPFHPTVTGNQGGQVAVISTRPRRLDTSIYGSAGGNGVNTKV